MNIILIIQLLINGIGTGFIYALLAIGFTLVWKSVSVANFAQGNFASIAMFAALLLYDSLDWPIPVVLVAAIALTAGMGIVMERISLRPIRQAHPLTKILATIGVSIVIRNSLRLIFGPMPRRFPPFLGLKGSQFGPFIIVPQFIGAAIIGLVLIVVLQELYYRTITGKALRAIAENREVASLMGINQNRMISLAFALSAALGATAGVLIAPLIFVTTEIEFNLLIKALLAALVGGFGSYPGALLGGIMIGVIDNLSSFYISSHFRDAISFSILIVILLVKPSGLLGKPIREI